VGFLPHDSSLANTAIVRPILLYGNIVWWHSLGKTCNLRILHKIQGSAELCISGALRTTATEALNTILDLQPLDLGTCNSAEAPPHFIIISKHTSLPRSTDYVPPIVNFERRYKIFIPTRTDWDNLPLQFENAVNIYTEGSKLNSQRGGGVFCPELDIKVSFRLETKRK